MLPETFFLPMVYSGRSSVKSKSVSINAKSHIYTSSGEFCNFLFKRYVCFYKLEKGKYQVAENNRVLCITLINHLAESTIFIVFSAKLYDEISKFFIQNGKEGMDMDLVKTSRADS